MIVAFCEPIHSSTPCSAVTLLMAGHVHRACESLPVIETSFSSSTTVFESNALGVEDSVPAMARRRTNHIAKGKRENASEKGEEARAANKIDCDWVGGFQRSQSFADERGGNRHEKSAGIDCKVGPGGLLLSDHGEVSGIVFGAELNL
jgi:hypothetical protein